MIHPGQLSAEQVGNENGAFHQIDNFGCDRIERVNGRYHRDIITNTHTSLFAKKSNKFLGMHMINERASDMIGEGLLAMKYLKADDVINTIHPHPTLVEAIREAVRDAYGTSIHSLNQNKRHSSKSLKHYVKD